MIDAVKQLEQLVAEYKKILSQAVLPTGTTRLGQALVQLRELMPQASSLQIEAKVRWMSYKDELEIYWTMSAYGDGTPNKDVEAASLDALMAAVKERLQPSGSLKEIESAVNAV